MTALQIHGTSMEEVEALSRAMVGAGRTIKFKGDKILDKHSIGGVPGDKTTLLVVPIIAAAGYIIPKSSSELSHRQREPQTGWNLCAQWISGSTR